MGFFAIAVRYANETPITLAAYAGIVIVVAIAVVDLYRFVKDGGTRSLAPARGKPAAELSRHG